MSTGTVLPLRTGRRAPLRRPTLLAVWAHPDDEAYLAAGLLATAVEAGWRVVLGTATRGEIGTDDPDGCPPDRLSELRTRELVDSLAALGVQEHRWLRARRPLVDGRLADVPGEEGITAVARLLDDVRPDRALRPPHDLALDDRCLAAAREPG
jgi:LmbE family N-acetylglucosaminyl deacetylase